MSSAIGVLVVTGGACFDLFFTPGTVTPGSIYFVALRTTDGGNPAAFGYAGILFPDP
ncbi:hypothetical protein tb265_39740 [Gemmatimonadetes bacterium T265]|nr:hypothetical protein tb265_39740 [Gemmatimonadetes bacterium T265]